MEALSCLELFRLIGPVLTVIVVVIVILLLYKYSQNKDGEFSIEMKDFDALPFLLVFAGAIFIIILGHLDAAIFILGMAFTYALFIMPRNLSDSKITAIITASTIGVVLLYVLLTRMMKLSDEVASRGKCAIYAVLSALVFSSSLSVLVLVVVMDHSDNLIKFGIVAILALISIILLFAYAILKSIINAPIEMFPQLSDVRLTEVGHPLIGVSPADVGGAAVALYGATDEASRGP